MLHFYLNFVGSKLQSIQYRVFSWPPDWGSHTTTTTIMAASPPSRDQPHSAPRAFAAARRRRPCTNTHPGGQDSTRHATKYCSLVGKPSRPTPYCKRRSHNPTRPVAPRSHVSTRTARHDHTKRRPQLAAAAQTPLPGRDPPSVEPAFPLSKTRGRYGCCNNLPPFSGQPTSPLPLSG